MNATPVKLPGQTNGGITRSGARYRSGEKKRHLPRNGNGLHGAKRATAGQGERAASGIEANRAKRLAQRQFNNLADEQKKWEESWRRRNEASTWRSTEKGTEKSPPGAEPSRPDGDDGRAHGVPRNWGTRKCARGLSDERLIGLAARKEDALPATFYCFSPAFDKREIGPVIEENLTRAVTFEHASYSERVRTVRRFDRESNGRTCGGKVESSDVSESTRRETSGNRKAPTKSREMNVWDETLIRTGERAQVEAGNDSSHSAGRRAAYGRSDARKTRRPLNYSVASCHR